MGKNGNKIRYEPEPAPGHHHHSIVGGVGGFELLQQVGRRTEDKFAIDYPVVGGAGRGTPQFMFTGDTAEVTHSEKTRGVFEQTTAEQVS